MLLGIASLAATSPLLLRDGIARRRWVASAPGGTSSRTAPGLDRITQEIPEVWSSSCCRAESVIGRTMSAGGQ
ncbi:MAG: hypothetical protein BGP03_00110 [Pseudonocardia sp. 73-21]|nr:MAG: hypothetical protein BGP03_00110 [Pseudonocardia sp. 73-21]